MTQAHHDRVSQGEKTTNLENSTIGGRLSPAGSELFNRLAQAPECYQQKLLAELNCLELRSHLHEFAARCGDPHRLNFPAISSAARSEFFKTPEFKNWVDSEKALGRRVLWL